MKGNFRILGIAAALALLAFASRSEATDKCAFPHDGWCTKPPPPVEPAPPVWKDTWGNSNWELGLPFGAALGLVGDQFGHKMGWAPAPRRLATMGVCALAAHVSELEDKRDIGNGYSKKGVIAGVVGCGLGIYASDTILVWQERNGKTMVGWTTKF